MDGRLTELERLVAAAEEVLPLIAVRGGSRLLEQRLAALLREARRKAAPAPLLAARLRALLAEDPEVYEAFQQALTAPRAFEGYLGSLPRQAEYEVEPGGPAGRVAPAPRFVNLAVLRAADFSRVPAETSLAPATDHLLRIDIGAISADSVVSNAGRRPFPAERLPPTTAGHWLEVAVASADFDVPGETFPMFLPRYGPSWVCPCPPGGAHVCRPSRREPYVLIPVRTPARTGTAHLRAVVWHRNAVVQSFALVADVAPAGHPGVHAATMDYTLTTDLADLESSRPRDLSVVTNRRPDGTHALIVNNGSGEITFTLAEGHLADAIGTVRELLLDVHVERIGRSRRNLLDRNNGKKPAPFAADLERLARNGWRLWAGLFQQQPTRLRGVTAGPDNTIQIARVPSSTFIFPWSAVYDLPLDPAPDTRYEPCPVVAGWDGVAPMFAGYPRDCPEQAQHRAKNTLCPFGFWGVRHAIEHPPSVTGRPLSREVRVVGRPDVVVVRSLALDRELSEDHLAAVAGALPDFTVTDVSGRDQACAALADHDLEIVEFYCHGRGDPVRHWLEVGRDEQIHPEQVTTWTVVDWAPPERHWYTTTPLVLLNGCHTAELTPQSPVSFVDCFAAANAGGVIGTEITLDQRLANEAGERLLGHFGSGATVGEAIRRMRLDLLRKGNLAGLAYTGYCSADLHLVRRESGH